jgi:tRNA(adenine34) deaminase
MPERADDARWMELALAQARAAAEADEVPVGAVIVLDGGVVAEGRNGTRTRDDPTAHAELVALREAAARVGWGLLDATVYVTLEPCAMCAGAMVLARLRRIVYAAPDPKTGMCGSLSCIPQDPRLNHRIELTRGVLADEASELLRAFFRSRRP